MVFKRVVRHGDRLCVVRSIGGGDWGSDRVWTIVAALLEVRNRGCDTCQVHGVTKLVHELSWLPVLVRQIDRVSSFVSQIRHCGWLEEASLSSFNQTLLLHICV